jgi:hypothetical protein
MNVIVTYKSRYVCGIDLSKVWERMLGYLISVLVVICMTTLLYNE